MPIWIRKTDGLPELWAVVVMPEMRQFVEDHIIYAFSWRFDKVRVQDDGAIGGAASPALLHLLQAKWWAAADPRQLLFPFGKPPIEIVSGFHSIPGPYTSTDAFW